MGQCSAKYAFEAIVSHVIEVIPLRIHPCIFDQVAACMHKNVNKFIDMMTPSIRGMQYID